MPKWTGRNRQLLLRVGGTAVAIALIALLLRGEAWNDVVAALQELSWTRIGAALSLVVASRLLVSARWYILLRSGGVRISAGRVMALTFTGLFANNFLPTTVGGDVVRLAGAMQLGYDRAVCVASIAADRLVGMLGMLLTLPLGLFPLFQNMAVGPAQATALPRLWGRGVAFLQRTARTFTVWLRRPEALLGAVACTLGHMLCTFLTMSMLIESLGSQVNFALIAGLWSVSYFVTLVPISINGYGVQELSLTLLFSNIAGLSTPTSVTVAVLMRAVYVAVSLVGAIFLPSILSAIDRREPAGPPLD